MKNANMMKNVSISKYYQEFHQEPHFYPSLRISISRSGENCRVAFNGIVGGEPDPPHA
jgi:hypothetical protein